MKKLLFFLGIAVGISLFLVTYTKAASTLLIQQGGTSSTTLSGILIGNGLTGLNAAINTLTVGSGLSLTGTTLTATGGGSSTFGTTSISATTPLQWNTSTAVLSILQAGTSQNGYLSSTDWNTFNNKQYAFATSTLTASSPLTGSFIQIGSGGSLGCQTASGSQAGCLSSTDWTTFNGKQAAGSYITALTGDGTASGPGSAAFTLANVNSNTGTFNNLTVNAKGLVTAASNIAYDTFGYLFPGNATTSSLTFGGVTITGASTGCATFTSGALSSTGTACGSGGSAYPFFPSTDGGINTSATTTPLEGAAIGLGLDVPVTSWYGIGGQLLAYASSTNQDTIFGLQAGGNNATTSATTGQNVAIGYKALNAMTTATDNTAIGYLAQTLTKTGGSNTAIGAGAMSLQPVTGVSNTAIGANAGRQITSGQNNVFIGQSSAGNGTISGQDNVGIGQSNFLSLSSASNNTAVGYQTGNGLSTAGNNSIFGFNAGTSLGVATNNTLIGYQAGDNITTGYDNIFLGETQNTGGNNVTTGGGNILIGYNPVTPTVSTNNYLNIGNSIFGTLNATSTSTSVPTSFTSVVIGIATTSPYKLLSIGGDTVIGAATAGGTLGNLYIPTLGTPAGTFIAADPTGKLIATTTPQGTSGAFSPAANYATVAGLPAYTYVAGVITEVSNGALSVDGNNPTVGQIILVKNESGACMSGSGACNNGLYNVTAAGSGIAAFVLTRNSNYNSSSNVIPGIVTYIISGATLADDFWAMTSAAPITVGTTALNYTEVSGGGAAVTSVSNSDSSLTITPTTGAVVGSLNINHSNIWTSLQVFNASVGVGSSTPFSALSVGTGAASSSITVAEYKYGKSGNVATSTAQNIDCNASTQIAEPIGTSATTLTLINMTPGKKCIVVVQNPGAAAGAITWAVQSGAILKWAGGTVPTQTLTANAMDIWSFLATQGSSTIQINGAQSANF